jgi:hypothetical protein
MKEKFPRCEDINKYLTSLALDELDVKTKHEIHQHLLTCKKCHEEFMQINKSIKRLKTLPEVRPSAERREAAILAMLKIKEEAKPNLVFYLRFAVPALAFVILAIIFVPKFIFAPALQEKLCYIKLIKGEALASAGPSYKKLNVNDIVHEKEWIEIDKDSPALFVILSKKDNQTLARLWANQNTFLQIESSQQKKTIYLNLIRGEIFLEPATTPYKFAVISPADIQFTTKDAVFEASLRHCFVLQAKTYPPLPAPPKPCAIRFASTPVGQVAKYIGSRTGRKIVPASTTISNNLVSFYCNKQNPDDIFREFEKALQLQGYAVVYYEKQKKFKIIRFYTESLIKKTIKTLLVKVLSGSGELETENIKATINAGTEAFLDEQGLLRCRKSEIIAPWRFEKQKEPPIELLDKKQMGPDTQILRFVSKIEPPSQPEAIILIKYNGEQVPVKVKMK